jgi:hypothetical protein
MKKYQILVIICVALALAAPVWAGNEPEFDAVGCDWCNGYVLTHLKYSVVLDFDDQVNFYSDFTKWDADAFVDDVVGPITSPGNLGRKYFNPYNHEYWEDQYDEWFYTNAGQLKFSNCYGVKDCNTGRILQALTDAYNSGTYEWQIVLQKKPESDLNINIFDCVLKHNETDISRYAEQTGRYRASWGELFFDPFRNPAITARAFGGPYAQDLNLRGAGMPLVARTMPGLEPLELNQVLYTSKAHWEEGIVVRLPQNGSFTPSGFAERNLKQGDKIYVRVNVPFTNSVDIHYGPSDVLIKYIGVIGTEYFGHPCPEKDCVDCNDTVTAE